MEWQRTQQHYHRPEKSGSDTIKGEGDTALEAKTQLYSDNRKIICFFVIAWIQL